jgi:hypothetical protein
MNLYYKYYPPSHKPVAHREQEWGLRYYMYYMWNKQMHINSCFSEFTVSLAIPEHLSSLAIFTGVRVTRSLVVYVCFADRRLSFCAFVLLAIVVSYPCSIFKLFFYHIWITNYQNVLYIVVCPFSFGHCAVCPWFANADYPFGTMKLLLYIV